MRTRTFRVYGIQWDTDNDRDILDLLPDEVEVTVTSEEVDDIDDDEEVEETISDYLTDHYDFCHCGFQMEEKKEGAV